MTKKQSTQTTDQSTARSAAVRENVGGSQISEHVTEDVGGGERNTLTNADHQGHLFNNRKTQEELSTQYANLAVKQALDLQASLNALTVQAVANAQAQANLVNNNSANASNTTNNHTAHNVGRTQAQEERHADLAIDNQWTSQHGVDDDTRIPKE